MRPSLQLAVQSVSGAESFGDLPVAQELVVGRDLTGFDAELDDHLRRVHLHLRRYDRVESADEGDADAAVVVAERMGADVVPAPADVRESVAADEEVVADVRPFSRLDVEGLGESHVKRTLGLRGAEVRDGVTDDHVGHRQLQLRQGFRGRLGAPLVSLDEAHRRHYDT